MIGHDHYFVDGNGRLARAALLLEHAPTGLWLTEFVSISAILRDAPVQYAHSYLNTGTSQISRYFFIHHLSVLDRAFDDLNNYLEPKVASCRREGLRQRPTHGVQSPPTDLIETACCDRRRVHDRVTCNEPPRRQRTAWRDLLDLEARGGFLTR